MKTNFAYFRIPFTKIHVSIALVVIIAILLWVDFSVYSFCIMLCALIHEVGHILALNFFGVEIYSITLLPFGAVIRSDAERLPYKKELVVALAGPVSNIVASLGLMLVQMVFESDVLTFFSLCGFILAFVNLVPVKTLDGARALEAILLEKMACEKAETYIENISSLAFAFLIFCSFILLVITGCNISLAVFCIYIFVSVYARKDI